MTIVQQAFIRSSESFPVKLVYPDALCR